MTASTEPSILTTANSERVPLGLQLNDIPPALGEPEGDIEDADPDAVLLWNDSGDTWWPEGGAPSYRA